MLRRTVLKLLGATAVSLPLDPVLARAAPKPLTGRVRPGEPGWPSEADWETLRQSVGGNLIKVEPLFPAGARRADDAGFLKNLRNPFFLGDQPGGTQVSGWYRAWTPAPSAYAVKARTTADVAAAVNFARAHNLRLAVKGTGHSYQGDVVRRGLAAHLDARHEQDRAARWLRPARVRHGARARRERWRGMCVDRPLSCGDDAGRALCAGRRLHGRRRGGARPVRRVRQLLEGFRHGGVQLARGGDRHRRRGGAHLQRADQSGSLLGDQGRRRRKLGRPHADHAAHP